MGIHNNNNTIVTMEQFLDNPEGLVKSTLQRQALLIILDNEWKEELAVFDCRDEDVVPISIKF